MFQWVRSLFSAITNAQSEFPIVDPTAVGDNKVRNISLAYLPSEEEDTAKISMYWTDSQEKVFEKDFDTNEEAQEVLSSLTKDLQEAAQLTKENKLDIATNLVKSLLAKYSINTGEIVQQDDVPFTMTNASLDKEAKAQVKNVFQTITFDSPEELMQYQEKMKSLQPQKAETSPLDSLEKAPDELGDELPADDDEVGPPSLSYEDAEKQDAEQQKNITKRIEQEVKEQINSQLEQKIATSFSEKDEKFVDGMKAVGRTWEEIRDYMIKELKYDKDSVAAYIDQKKAKEDGVAPKHKDETPAPEAPKPPHELVSPETHDKLLDEITPEKEIDKKDETPIEETPKEDVKEIEEISQQDVTEIRKVAKEVNLDSGYTIVATATEGNPSPLLASPGLQFAEYWIQNDQLTVTNVPGRELEFVISQLENVAKENDTIKIFEGDMVDAPLAEGWNQARAVAAGLKAYSLSIVADEPLETRPSNAKPMGNVENFPKTEFPNPEDKPDNDPVEFPAKDDSQQPVQDFERDDRVFVMSDETAGKQGFEGKFIGEYKSKGDQFAWVMDDHQELHEVPLHMVQPVEAQATAFKKVELTKEADENAEVSTEKWADSLYGIQSISAKPLENGNLEISVTDESERQEIADAIAGGDVSDNSMYDAFERLVANGYSWIAPEQIGALTSAPILSDSPGDDQGNPDPNANYWWYPQYETRSPMEDLAETGKTIFTLAKDEAKQSAKKELASIQAEIKQIEATLETEAHKAFDVFLNGQEIDTVFYNDSAHVDAEEVKRSLIDHDSYDPNIEVVERKPKRGPLERPTNDEQFDMLTGKVAEYQPKTGEPCSCRPGQQRDNCPSCEGTGMRIDFKKIRDAKTEKEAGTVYCSVEGCNGVAHDTVDGKRYCYKHLWGLDPHKKEASKKCKKCSVPEHDQCGNDRDCPCCADSMRKDASATTDYFKQIMQGIQMAKSEGKSSMQVYVGVPEAAQEFAASLTQQGYTVNLEQSKGPSGDHAGLNLNISWEKTASVKEAAPPVQQQPDPTKFKDYKISPPETKDKQPENANPEVMAAVREFQETKSFLDQLEADVKVIQANAAAQVAKLREERGQAAAAELYQQRLDKLASLIRMSHDKVVSVEDSLLTLNEGVKHEPYAPSHKELLNKMVEHFKGAKEYLQKVVNGMQNQATDKSFSEVIRSPKRQSSFSLSKREIKADALDMLDAIYSEMVKAWEHIKAATSSLEPEVPAMASQEVK